jgi:hypothetical protein
MIDTARGRIAVVLLVLAVHILLFPVYAAQPVNPDAGVFPGNDDVIETPDRYVGDRVTVSGDVRQTEPLTISVDAKGDTIRVTITDADASPASGDFLRVYGFLEGPQEISAIETLVVPSSGRWYAWTVSALAGLWVLARLLAHWRVDTDTLAFEPRDRARSLLGTLRSLGGDR